MCFRLDLSAGGGRKHLAARRTISLWGVGAISVYPFSNSQKYVAHRLTQAWKDASVPVEYQLLIIRVLGGAPRTHEFHSGDFVSAIKLTSWLRSLISISAHLRVLSVDAVAKNVKNP